MIVNQRSRPGAIAPLAVFFMLFLLVMVSFAVDFSWVVLSQTELQSTADAAALAGANSLLDHYVDYHLPNQSANRKSELLTQAFANARKAAKQTASLNGAGDKTTLTLRDDDIEFGVTDQANVYTPLGASTGQSAAYPNTVKVKLRRDHVANGALDLYFGRVIGMKEIALGASAASAVYGGAIDGFKTNTKYNIGVLPVTYDVNHWNQFLKTGKDPDGKITLSADGDPELLVYPSVKYKGNFGLLSLDDGTHNANQIDEWIHSGMKPGDVQTLFDHSLLPLSARVANLWDWEGAPGFKSSNVMDVNAYIGGTYLLPLFKPVVPTETGYRAGIGQGQNFNYNIVEFVGIRIVAPDDKNREIVVRPAAVVVPEALYKAGTLTPPVLPDNDSAKLVTTFAVPKLTQ
jgi:Flp pilus assembly protein TadG